MKRKIIIIISLFTIIFFRLLYINFCDKSKYRELLLQKTDKYVYGESAPRGRILDCNGNVLVDNVGIKTVYYIKPKNITVNEELRIASELANLLSVSISNNDKVLKKYWLLLNNNGENLISKDEYELYNLRKITSEELLLFKYQRITNEMLDEFSDFDKKVATIYDLMNKGYSYDKKLIIKNIDDSEYSKIVDKNILGITTELTWERIYNYGDVLKDIFGTVGSIPEENKIEYLKNGYELNDVVGLSYLEYQYEDYLKGEKDLYKVNSDNTLTLVKKGNKGNDLVLSIDIDAQLYLEKLIKENILNAKKNKNTIFFSELYSIVGNPNTGEIIAMSGQKLIDEEKEMFRNVNTNLINTSYTVGSVVKMATLSTGYKYGVVDIDTKMRDGCVKLYQVPLKCSYKDLGNINDLTSISKSSNYYQFKIAIGITENAYKYNMKLNSQKSDFDKFRNMFEEYGLGAITGIDLPNESIGIIGSIYSSDLLLNLSIGQYDTYTPIELFQYVNTIASKGVRRSPQLMKKISGNNSVLVDNLYQVMSVVELNNKYLERLKSAMHLACSNGTARGYINAKFNGAGKTGTSETFIDTNNDNIMDTKTISNAFVGFAPYDNPKYSVVVLAPNLYVSKEEEYIKVPITRYISRDITNFLFENH